jgi:hypothetical protein
MSDKNPQQMPDISSLRVAVIQLHELYEELKTAGFSRKEALYLVGVLLTTGLSAGEQ